MPSEMRLWRVGDGRSLTECSESRLELEEQLEEWLAPDIGILSTDLLVIGRQVDTKVCGVIDLFCLDSNGDTVVVELKRDKTPRTVVAQVLDYASWVVGLSAERLVEISDAFLGGEGELAAVFSRKFGAPLPDVLNGQHHLLIVGSSLDPASERIIQYLSEEHGVPINFAGFQVFAADDGSQLLGRVFLIEPAQAETRITNPRKRRPNLDLDTLQRIAEKHGVGSQYAALFDFLDRVCDGRSTTQSSVSFKVRINDSTKAVFNLIPTDSEANTGLHYQVYDNRFEARFSISPASLRQVLPDTARDWAYGGCDDPDYHGYEGWFATVGEVERFKTRLATSVPGFGKLGS